MTWGRIDDKLHSHAKVERAGLEAMGLWVLALSYCLDQLTDGFVSEERTVRLVGDRKKASALSRKLCAERLWHRADEPCPSGHAACDQYRRAEAGFRFHDWDDYQPSRAEVSKERARKKANIRAFRDRQRAAPVTVPVTGYTGGNEPREQPQLQPPTNHGPDPDPDPKRSLTAVAEDLTGSRAPEPVVQQQRQALSAEWLLGELRRHKALEPVATPDFAGSLLGVLVGRPKPLDVVAQAIADAALHSAGLGIAPEALQRKVSGYVLNARRREAPPAETRCPASTSSDAPAWLAEQGLPALSSGKGADVALMLDHYAERAQTSANWRATWSKWAAAERHHPSGPAPGHRPKRQREDEPALPPVSMEQNLEAIARLRGALEQR